MLFLKIVLKEISLKSLKFSLFFFTAIKKGEESIQSDRKVSPNDKNLRR